MRGDEGSSYHGGGHGGARWHDACGERPVAASPSEAPPRGTGFEGQASPCHFAVPPVRYEGRPWHWPDQTSLSPAQQTWESVSKEIIHFRSAGYAITVICINFIHKKLCILS